MNLLVVILVIAALLFSSSYVAKRRFGLLGLALAAGYLLSKSWNYDAGLLASGVGIKNTAVNSAVIVMIITLLPSIMLLFHGYAYKNVVGRLVGSTLFTTLALVFLIEPIGRVASVQGGAVQLYNFLYNNQDFLIGVGLILAVLDIFLTKPVQNDSKKG